MTRVQLMGCRSEAALHGMQWAWQRWPTSAGATQGFVGGGGDHVGALKGVAHNASSDQP